MSLRQIWKLTFHYALQVRKHKTKYTDLKKETIHIIYFFKCSIYQMFTKFNMDMSYWWKTLWILIRLSKTISSGYTCIRFLKEKNVYSFESEIYFTMSKVFDKMINGNISLTKVISFMMYSLYNWRFSCLFRICKVHN